MNEYTRDIESINGYRFMDKQHKKELIIMFNDDHELELTIWNLNANVDSDSAISTVKIDMQSGKMLCENF